MASARHKRILICDDNRDAAESLSLLLASEHDTFVCVEGRSCVEKARAWRPEVAILDIGLPGMSGFSVARAIREMDFGNEVLLLAVSGYDPREHPSLFVDSPFDRHLTKPADPAQVVALVNGQGADRQ